MGVGVICGTWGQTVFKIRDSKLVKIYWNTSIAIGYGWELIALNVMQKREDFIKFKILIVEVTGGNVFAYHSKILENSDAHREIIHFKI